jgi:uncharacterized protein
MPISDLSQLLKNLKPELNTGTFVFATLTQSDQVEMKDVIALVREPEGVSVIVEEQRAFKLGLNTSFKCAWITLTVNSDLNAIGLTAAFASTLGQAGISCNVVAGTNHDHIFVPVDQALKAMNELHALQKQSARVDTQ